MFKHTFTTSFIWQSFQGCLQTSLEANVSLLVKGQICVLRPTKITSSSWTTLVLLLLSRFSRVRLCATPEKAAHQAPPSLGVSRQEHWSGLPFPSPVHEKWKAKVKSLSHVWLLATPWTAAYQAPPSMGFSRQEYWSGVPLPSLDYFASSPLIILGGIINSGFLSYATITNCLHKT